jgi:hypothetical protein
MVPTVNMARWKSIDVTRNHRNVTADVIKGGL